MADGGNFLVSLLNNLLIILFSEIPAYCVKQDKESIRVLDGEYFETSHHDPLLNLIEILYRLTRKEELLISLEIPFAGSGI
jgi:hypothetical protein